jgi:hypothetical protein
MKKSTTNNTQNLYDNFNGFILSHDTRIFNKLITRTLLYDKIKDIPGDIVECGVFKGSGTFTFLKLKNIFNPNSSKKVIGFDFFNTDELIKSIQNGQDKDPMNTLFDSRNFKHTDSFKTQLENDILEAGFKESDFMLIAGDVSLTTKDFSRNNPGLKIAMLYMDVDLELPTYDVLNNLWDNMTKGGLIVFDEYGHHKWSESKGVDRFLEEKNLEIVSLNNYCPTAYIQKK